MVQGTSVETENIKSGQSASRTSWWRVPATTELVEECQQASLGSLGGPPARGVITLLSVTINVRKHSPSP